MKDVVHDPQNYYSKYEWSGNTYLILNTDGTAELSLNGEKTDYSFIYVNEEWLRRNLLSSSSTESIILYHPDSTECLEFSIKTEDTMVFARNTFTRNHAFDVDPLR